MQLLLLLFVPLLVHSIGILEGDVFPCNLPGLSTRQRDICAHKGEAVKTLWRGVRAAFSECSRVFQNSLWDCSSKSRNLTSHSVTSKETAYIHAISSAGVTHSLASGCARGELPDCGCGANPAAHSRDFIWSGCSHNVKYGNAFSRRFIDENSDKDPRAAVNLHNNRVGRRLLSRRMEKECKCHGVSGSCVTRTCWKVVPKFAPFADELKAKYDDAVQVEVARRGSEVLLRGRDGPARIGRYLKEVAPSPVAKNVLVYLDPSPDFCSNPSEVSGRPCGENCDELCCGRGWTTTRRLSDEPCHCQFVWCCEVKCRTCTRVVDDSHCK